MEDVLAVYTRPRDPDRPVVCLDETSKQLIAETRAPVAMQPGRPARIDYEYTRNGAANMFMMFAPLEGWRNVEVTDRRTAIDYAHVLKDLADVYFAQAETIVLIQDNLNTHAAASLYEAFPAPEARRLVERFEWHYTPKHGSWLDLAESELGALASQCLDRCGAPSLGSSFSRSWPIFSTPWRSPPTISCWASSSVRSRSRLSSRTSSTASSRVRTFSSSISDQAW